MGEWGAARPALSARARPTTPAPARRPQGSFFGGANHGQAGIAKAAGAPHNASHAGDDADSEAKETVLSILEELADVKKARTNAFLPCTSREAEEAGWGGARVEAVDGRDGPSRAARGPRDPRRAALTHTPPPTPPQLSRPCWALGNPTLTSPCSPWTPTWAWPVPSARPRRRSTASSTTAAR